MPSSARRRSERRKPRPRAGSPASGTPARAQRLEVGLAGRAADLEMLRVDLDRLARLHGGALTGFRVRLGR